MLEWLILTISLADLKSPKARLWHTHRDHHTCDVEVGSTRPGLCVVLHKKGESWLRVALHEGGESRLLE